MKPFRIDKLSSEIKHIVSDAIHHHLQDPRISPLTSVTRVEVSPDLDWAKVYVSILGDRADHSKTIAGLKSAAGFIQRMLAQALHARQCPHLSFCLDESITKGNEVMHIIQESMDELARDADRSRQGSAAADPTSEGATG